MAVLRMADDEMIRSGCLRRVVREFLVGRDHEIIVGSAGDNLAVSRAVREQPETLRETAFFCFGPQNLENIALRAPPYAIQVWLEASANSRARHMTAGSRDDRPARY